MNIGVKILIFIFAFYLNLVSAIIIYQGDKKRYQQNVYGKMLECKIFRLFLKFDRKTTQIYLKTFIGNLLFFVNIIIEIIFLLIALTSLSESVETIICFGAICLSLLFTFVIKLICDCKTSQSEK